MRSINSKTRGFWVELKDNVKADLRGVGLKIFFCGDVMTGRGIDQILRHPSDPRLYEGYVRDARDYVKLAERANGPIPRQVAPEYIWGDALEIWRERKPDLKVVNLETAITTSQTADTKGINYRMHPDNAAALSAAGIDACALANNHVLDWGLQGMRETISTLDRLGIKHAGAGENIFKAQQPAILEAAGGRVLVFSLGAPLSGIPFEWGATKDSPGVWLLNALNDEVGASVQEAVTRYRQPGDTAVASIHWGSNWGYEVPESHVRFAHALIDEAGIDIIHGHSSHHPRPIELYKGRPIFYGCGDFINDYEGIRGYEEFRDDLVLTYFVDFDPAPFRLHKMELVPLQIHRFRLRRAADEDALWLLGRMKEASETLHFRDEGEGGDKVKVI